MGVDECSCKAFKRRCMRVFGLVWETIEGDFIAL